MIERVRRFSPCSVGVGVGTLQCSIEASGVSMVMDGSSSAETSFSVIDLSSGLAEATYLLACYARGRYNSVVYFKKIALFYNTASGTNNGHSNSDDGSMGSTNAINGTNNSSSSSSSSSGSSNNEFSIFDLDQGCHVHTITVASMRSNQAVIAATASPCKPGVFFFATTSDSSYPFIYAITFNSESSSVRCIDISLRDFPVKSRGPIHDLLCHPDSPYLLVGLGDGFVQVWDYINLNADGNVDLSSEAVISNRDGDGVNADERSEDGGDGASQSSTSQTMANKQPKNRANVTSSSSRYMTPMAVFLHPDNTRDPYATRQHKLFQSVSLRINNKLLSVVWDRSLVCVYNSGFGSISRASRVSLALLSPIGKYSSPSAICLGSACFHPTMPVLCQLAKGNGRKFLLALLLSTSNMGLLDSTDVDIDTNIDFMHVSFCGHLILRSSTSSHMPSVVSMSSFKRSWTEKFGFNEPLISTLSIPTKIFTEGSSTGQIQPLTSFSSYISIHPYIEVGASSPLDVSFTICTMNKPETNSLPFKPVAAFPNIIPVTASTSTRATWPVLPEDHIAAPPGAVFFPSAVKSNPNFKITANDAAGVVASSEPFVPWEAVVMGCSLTETTKLKGLDGETSNLSTPGNDHNEGQLYRQNLICIIQSTEANKMENVFLSALDADFWCGFFPVVPTAKDGYGSGLLVLSQSGQKLSWISSIHLVTSGDPRLSAHTQFSIDLKMPLYRIWTCLPGSPNLVIGLTYITERNKSTPMDCLMISASTELQFDLSSNPFFVFWLSESVLDVKWQPSTALSEHLEETRNYDMKPLIAVLTDRRILILDITMKLRAQKIIHSDPLTIATDSVDSISWIGSSLAYCVSSGQVRYLVPTSSVPETFETRRVNIKRYSLGCGQSSLYVDDDMDPDVLALLPPAMTRNRSTRIIACLPDRLLLSSIKSSADYVNFLSFTTRPCIPAEAVIRGLLISHHSLSATSKDVVIDPLKEALKALLVSNFQSCPESSGGNVGENGAIPSSQSSAKLSLHLYESKYPELASLISGNTISVTKQTFSQFPICRWIPTGLKFLYSLAAGRTKEACVDLFSQYPKLQELISGEESFSTGSLPHRESLLGGQIFSATCLLLSLGHIDEAVKLADIVGNDELLAVIISTLKDGQVAKEALNSLLTAVADKNHLLREILISKCNIDDDENVCDLYPRQSSLKFLGKYCRRSGLLKFTSASSTDTKKVNGDFFDAEGVENARKTHSNKRCGGLGAITGHGVLSMDGIEEWLGRLKPDHVSTHTVGNKMRFGTPSQVAGSDDEKEDEATAQSRPPTWVPDIGKGKDVDKVVGYWRFSDQISEADADFVSNIGEPIDMSVVRAPNPTPTAIMNFIDLSKYCTILELINDKHSNMEPVVPVTVEESQSAVDPGEDKEKVKNLNDLVFPMQDDMFRTSAIRAALRIKVERGTAMDIGMYHSLPERRKMTIEMMVSRLEDPNAKKGTTKQVNTMNIQKHYLAVRLAGQPSGSLDASMLIWSLFTEMDGSVGFLMGADKPGNQQMIKTNPSVLKTAGHWTHVALAIDSTNSFIPDRPLDAATAAVSIYINGELSKSGDITVPSITENQIEVSCVYVGLNLSGWRLTELRFWADIRTSTEIDTNMENYLPHASKRKRLQFRIIGSKRLFSKATTTSSMNLFGKKPLLPLEVSNGSKPAVGNFQIPQSNSASASLAKPGSANDSATVGGGSSALAARKARMGVAAAEKLTTAISKPPLSTFSSSIIAPPSSSLSSITPGSTIVTIKRVSSLPDLGLALKDAMSCLRRAVLPERSLDNNVAFCQKADNDRVLAVIRFRNDESWSVASKRTTFSIPSESVLSSPVAPIFTILAADSKSIVSFYINGGKKIVQQPLVFPLVFWSPAENSSKVLLVLPHSVYSWDSMKPNVPLKLFDRTDIASQKRWMERKALNIHSLKDKYVLLDTCRRVTSENKPCSQALADEFSVVTLHVKGEQSNNEKEVEKERIISFRGLSSAFLPDKNGQDSVAIIYLDGSSYMLALLNINCLVQNSYLEEIDLSASDCPLWSSSFASMNKRISLSTENSKNFIPGSNQNFLSPPAFLFASSLQNVLHVLMRNGEYYAIDIAAASKHEKVPEPIQIFAGSNTIGSSSSSSNKRGKFVLAAGLYKPWEKQESRSNITVLTSEATFEMCFIDLE